MTRKLKQAVLTNPTLRKSVLESLRHSGWNADERTRKVSELYRTILLIVHKAALKFPQYLLWKGIEENAIEMQLLDCDFRTDKKLVLLLSGKRIRCILKSETSAYAACESVLACNKAKFSLGTSIRVPDYVSKNEITLQRCASEHFEEKHVVQLGVATGKLATLAAQCASVDLLPCNVVFENGSLSIIDAETFLQPMPKLPNRDQQIFLRLFRTGVAPRFSFGSSGITESSLVGFLASKATRKQEAIDAFFTAFRESIQFDFTFCPDDRSSTTGVEHTIRFLKVPTNLLQIIQHFSAPKQSFLDNELFNLPCTKRQVRITSDRSVEFQLEPGELGFHETKLRAFTKADIDIAVQAIDDCEALVSGVRLRCPIRMRDGLRHLWRILQVDMVNTRGNRESELWNLDQTHDFYSSTPVFPAKTHEVIWKLYHGGNDEQVQRFFDTRFQLAVDR